MTFNPKMKDKHGISLLEVLVVCFGIVLLSGLVIKLINSETQNKKVASVKTSLGMLHQYGLQTVKKFEFMGMNQFLQEPGNANLSNCFLLEAGVACDTIAPIQPLMHRGAGPLSNLQIEENAFMNGGFNLDGTLCTNADVATCPIRNQTQMSFNCSSTRCASVAFQVNTSLNNLALNSEDKTLLAPIAAVESLAIHDRTKESGNSRTTASCGSAGGSFGFNSQTGEVICSTGELPSVPILFASNFGTIIQNGALELVGGGGTTGGTTSPPNPPTCIAPEVLSEIKDDGTVVCKRPILQTCSGERIFSNGELVGGAIGNENYCLVRVPAGVTIYVNGTLTLAAQVVEIFGHINANGRGYAGGNGGSGGHGGDINGCRGAAAGGGAGGNGQGPRGGAGNGSFGGNAQSIGEMGSGGGGGRGGSGAANSGHWEAPGGGGGGGGGAGGGAVSIYAGELNAAGGVVSVLGTRYGGNGAGGSGPPDNWCGGAGGGGGAGAHAGQSLGSSSPGGGACHYSATGCGAAGQHGGGGGDGSFYFEYSTILATFSTINKGNGFFQYLNK